MSKWHIPFRAHGGDPSARRAWGREGGRRGARARCTGSGRGGRGSPRPRVRAPGPEAGGARGGEVLVCARVELLAGLQ